MVGGWRLVAAGGWRRLAVGGSWRLAVGGPLGRSLRAVFNKTKNVGPKGPPWALDEGCLLRGCSDSVRPSHIGSRITAHDDDDDEEEEEDDDD